LEGTGRLACLERSWFDAACSPDGKLIAVTATGNGDEHRIDSADRAIWLLAPDQSVRRVLVGKAGDGVSDEAPRWSSDGRFVLYVEHSSRAGSDGALYLLDVRSGKRRGPLARFAIGDGYYGLRDWSRVVPWLQR
jgi:Tol biopolymer transport system component